MHYISTKKPIMNINCRFPFFFFNCENQNSKFRIQSSRLVYHSILDHFVKRSQYISFKIPFHNQSDNPWVCYLPRQSTTRDFTVSIKRFLKYTGDWHLLYDDFWVRGHTLITLARFCQFLTNWVALLAFLLQSLTTLAVL